MYLRFSILIFCTCLFWACSSGSGTPSDVMSDNNPGDNPPNVPPTDDRMFKEYYTPNIDLFIFRHNSSLSNVDRWRRGFDISGVSNVVDYLFSFFSDSATSVGKFQKQNQMVFNASHVRAFIVTPHRGIDTTYMYSLPVRMNGDQYQVNCAFNSITSRFINFSTLGIEPSSAVIVPSDIGQSYVSDLYFAGYDQEGLSSAQQKKLYLTNYEGTNTTGAEVFVDPNRLRIFFADTIEPCSPETGQPLLGGVASSIGNSQTLSEEKRVSLSIAISSRYNSSAYGLRNPARNLQLSISHELGHFFGLQHSFDRLSCDRYTMGTTDRIMDYISQDTPRPPSVFAPCEQDIYKRLSGVFLNQKKVSYEVDDEGNIKSPQNPNTEIQSVLYRSLSTRNQIAVDEGRFEIIDADSYPQNSSETPSKKTISMDSISDIKPVF